MRQDSVIIIVLAAIMLFGPGCSWEPGVDKAKFAEVNGVAQDLKTAIASGRACDAPDALLQRLASGTTALKDRTASQAERDLVAAFSHLLTTYRDGLLLCRYRARPPQFQFVPRGRVYVFQELDPLVEKYDLPTESHVYTPTGVRWRSIAGDSIQVIWGSAEDEIRNIENMVKYN